MMSNVYQCRSWTAPVPIDMKLEAIRYVKRGESKASVARKFGVPESTLRGWCKSESKILALANSDSHTPEKTYEPPEAKRSRLDTEAHYNMISMGQQPICEVNGHTVSSNNSWFWDFYKQYKPQTQGYSDLSESCLEPVSLVKPKTTLPTVSINFNNNNILDKISENRADDVTQISEDDDKPSAEEALEHGEKFLRWLESCSNPSVTTFQLLQYRYLLHNVRSSVKRKAGRPDGTPKAKRK